MPERSMTITQHAPNDYTVTWGTECMRHLTWDELLGQIASMTCPRPKAAGGLESYFATAKTMDRRYAEEHRAGAVQHVWCGRLAMDR